MRKHAWLLAVMVASCKQCDAPPSPVREASAPSATLSAEPPPPRVVREAGTTSTFDAGSIDAGASACKLAYGPAEQPFRGPAAMIVKPTELRLVANDAGKPKVFGIPNGAATPPKPATFVGMRWPPCEIAGRFAYCQAPGGIILRTPLDGGESKQIAESRSGTQIAAAALGPNHTMVAFFDMKHTTEGERLQAFTVLDEGDVERLSEEGAGATALHLAPRGDGAIAIYLDSRTSMVPVHARSVSLKGEKLALGADTVVFVGGAPERGIDFAIAGTEKTEHFVLLPMSHETSDFGMAAIPVHDPPKTDVPAVWSLYPNGLDPAPIAWGGGFVARVRPRESEVGSPRILELGRLDDKGAFTSLGAIADARRVTDIAMAGDKDGVWILYGDSNATFLEKRICPP